MHKHEVEKFNVLLLYNTVHDEKTKKMAKEMGEGHWSQFVRKAILKFAEDKGFEAPTNKPPYMPPNKWQKIQVAQEKKRHVNYDYVIAYHWLKSLPSYSYVQKSEIIREAIKYFYASFYVQADFD